MKTQATTSTVSVNVDGTVRDATYTVGSKVVTVESAYGSASTQIGGLSAEAVARLLLREILAGAKARGELYTTEKQMMPKAISDACAALFDAWCERCAVGPLRLLLRVWPLTDGLTDDWGEFYEALRSIQADRSLNLPAAELEGLAGIVRGVSAIIHRQTGKDNGRTNLWRGG